VMHVSKLYRSTFEPKNLYNTSDIELVMDKCDFRWLACAIDCDGVLGTNTAPRTKNKSVVVGFTNTNMAIIEEFENLCRKFGCRVSMDESDTYITEKGTPSSVTYSIRLAGTPQEPGHEEKLRFLLAIEPYLIVKRKLALEAIETLKRKIEVRKRKDPRTYMEPECYYTNNELGKMMGVLKNTAYARARVCHKKGLIDKILSNGICYWGLKT